MAKRTKGFRKAAPGSNQGPAIKSKIGIWQSQLQSYMTAAMYREALSVATEIVEADPDQITVPDFVLLLVKLRIQVGEFASCISLLESAINARPSSESLRECLSRLHGQDSNWKAATDSWHGWYPESTPGPPTLQHTLARLIQHAVVAFNEHRYLDGALMCCRYIALRPDNADVWSNLGIFQTRIGHFKASEESLRQSLKLSPGRSSVWNSLGILYSKTVRHSEAIDAFKKSIDIDPSNPNPWSNLANEYHIKAQLDDAYRCSAKALELQKGVEPGFDHLTRMRRVCDLDGIRAWDWLSAAKKMPVNSIPHASLNLLTLACKHEDHIDLKTIYQRWAEWIQSQADQSPLVDQLGASLGRSGSPIRIGLLSADLRDHSVAKFLEPIVDHLDPQRFRIEAFSCYPDHNDPVQSSLRKRIADFHDIERMSHRELASFIRRRCIDVLIDLTGFTNHNRAGVLAFRPAPVQIAWLGYPGTMGLRDLDYILLDKYLAPESRDYMLESPLLMAGSSICFSGLVDVPINPVAPFIRNGYVTFGSLNNSYKITGAVVELWSRVLGALPDARLVFFRREFESAILQKNLRDQFERHGISSARIEMYNNRAQGRHHLDCYNDFDLSMDTFPVVGGTTTCDALWMGVPVIALQGGNIHQRVCSAILRNLGCDELVSLNADEFVHKALSLATDADRLSIYRKTLRDRMKNSVLCDSREFASNFSVAIEHAVSVARQETDQEKPGA